LIKVKGEVHAVTGSKKRAPAPGDGTGFGE